MMNTANYVKTVGTHFIIQVEISPLGAYEGISLVLDVYPGAMRILLESPGTFTLKQWISHAIPSNPSVKAAWAKFGAGAKIPITAFFDNLKELVDGMATRHTGGIWPERFAELHSSLFGIEVRGTNL